MCLYSAGSGDHEEIANARPPVQEVTGAADEDAVSVSTVLCALHQTKRKQGPARKSSYPTSILTIISHNM